MKTKIKRFTAISLVILVLCSILLVPSKFTQPVKADWVSVPDYTNSGLVTYSAFETGEDQVVTPSRYAWRDDSYIAAKGDLTLKETDLSIPGRGLDLTIQRVYTTPAVFEDNAPYGYESPPIDVGRGWTLDFPWIGNLLHFWDGTCYEIEWSGDVFENHMGAHFKFIKEADGTYTLYNPSGTILHFDTSGKLKTIEDNNENRITFAYENGLLINITDTIGRVAHLSYSNDKLSRISYSDMTVEYTYSSGALVEVKDVQGRYSYYEYESYNAWLITKVKSPTGSSKTYTYTRFSSEVEDATYHKYKIASEKTYDSKSNLVNAKIFSYSGDFSAITSSITKIKGSSGVERVRHRFIMDTEGLTTSFTVLNISAAQTQEGSESHSATGGKFTGGGYWEDDSQGAWYFYARWVDLNEGEGHMPIGPFNCHPGTTGYTGYETAVTQGADKITVTTYWSTTTIPKLRKTLYTYNSRKEVIKEDVYVGNTSILSYSIYRRHDNWGNLIYSRNPIGHEKVYSYANTETSGIFLDYNGDPKTGFSNLFYSNTVPSNIHSALLRKAELQDDETAVETYLEYDANGNPIEKRRLLGDKTPFEQSSGTFDESGSTSFSIDLTGIDVQGNAMLKVTGMPKVNYIQKTESHSETGKGFTGTGYWQGRYFYAYWVFMSKDGPEDGHTPVGPFTHYPGTAGYKEYTTSTTSRSITVTTYYNDPVDRYPAKVDYRFNSYGWSTITNNLGSSTEVQLISPSELNAGTNTLYFRESSSYKTKFSWELHVPDYTAPKEDLKKRFTYDSHGNVASITDAEGTSTIFEYSPDYEQAYCTKTINTVDGYNITTSSTYYFDRGLVASTTNPEGHVTLFEYDNLGRTTRVTNPDGSQSTIVYDDANDTITYYDQLGHKVRECFDGLGRRVKIERYLTDTEVYSVQTSTYNYADKILTKTVPHEPGTLNPATYSFEYDALGRATKKINPDGTSSTTRYDDINNTVTVIDENQHSQKFKYDWIGRPLWVKENNSSSSYYLTQYEYDERGHITKVVDAKGQTTLYEYGSLFGRTRKIYCDSTYEQVAYSKIGNVIWVVDRNGDNTTLTYDELHRLVQTTFADGETRSYAYDNRSRLVSTSHIDYSNAYQYDCRGRMIQESHSIRDGGDDPYDVLFTYDAANRLLNMTYPDGLIVSFEYDSLNRVTQVHSGDYVFAAFNYNIDDTTESITYGNGLKTTYSYDNRLRLTQQIITDPSQGDLTMLSLNYTYDNVGNINQIVNGRRTPLGTWLENTQNYGYDWLDRLTSADGAFGEIQYSYDAVGNRITETENGTATSYEYDACNRLVSSQRESTNATFTYDNNGNLRTRSVANETWHYVYNKENQLCQVSKGQILGSYRYDADGRRVYQLEGAKTTTTVYSGLNPIYEHILQSGNHTAYDYIYGPTGRLSRICDNQVVYYHSDHLGSTRLVTDTSGEIVTTRSYKPFGETYETHGSEERFGFNGKEEDSQTGLYYYGARYYDPEVGRFTQADSYGGRLSSPQSQNRYTYCKNNPLKYIDPSGHFTTDTGNGLFDENWDPNDAQEVNELLEDGWDPEDAEEANEILEEYNEEKQGINEDDAELLVKLIETVDLATISAEIMQWASPNGAGVTSLDALKEAGSPGTFSAIGAILTAIQIGLVKADETDGFTWGKAAETAVVTASTVGSSIAGAWIGAAAGAKLGATIGIPGGPLGIAIAGAGGALVGGFLGSKFGRAASEWVCNKFEEVLDNASPAPPDMERGCWDKIDSL